jgi:hypothetical protein
MVGTPFREATARSDPASPSPERMTFVPNVSARRSVSGRRVEIEAEIALTHESPIHRVGHPLGRVRPFLAREGAVEVLIVDGEIPLLGLIPRDAHHVEADEGAVDLGRPVACGDFLEHFDAVEFVAVERRGQADPRPVPFAVDDGHGNLDGVAEIRLAHLEAKLAFLAGIDVDVDPKRPWLVVGHGCRV